MKYKPRIKAAIYVRSARADDKEIVHQINTMLRMIDRNDENLVGVYADNGASGLTLERPEFQRMLGDAKGGRFTKLYIRDIERISRDLGTLATAIEQLHVDGVAIVTRDNPDGPKLIIA
jgi:site-specific DNA recombinase